MSVIKANGAGSAGADFYTYKIGQSLRIDNVSAELNRTPSGSGDSVKTWTVSFWMKRCGNLGDYHYILSSGNTSNEIVFRISNNDTLHFQIRGGLDAILETSRLFRDFSSWYHLVLRVDTTQAAAADRVRLYINGGLVAWNTSYQYHLYPDQNDDTTWNASGIEQIIGRRNNTGFPISLYIAEFHNADGLSLAPSSFGETKDGVWVPKQYSGGHGTNGFYLPFDDSSAIGDDESANTNDMTVVSLSAHDVVPDSPTNNFATMSPLLTDTNNTTFSEGTLKTVNSAASTSGSSIAVNSGKWFVEMVCTAKTASNAMIGICTVDGFDGERQLDESQNGGSGHGYVMNATKLPGSASYGATWAVDDIIGIALDLDSSQNTVTFYKNGSSQGAININNALYVFCNSNGQGSSTVTYASNFGQDGTFAGEITAGGNSDGNGVGDFKYSVPSGYLALCTKNLPDPAIGPTADTLATDNFNTVTYTGDDGANRAVTGVGFAPDWVWIKNRDVAEVHSLYDTVRGATNQLFSNTDDEEADRGVYGLRSFGSDGFSVGPGGEVNDANEKYVAWNWKAGGSASNNSDGDITSSVSANTAAGFSIGTYTGNGQGSQTIGHGLSSAPGLVIIKQRSGGNDWVVFDKFRPDTEKYLRLNTNNDYYDYGATLMATPGADTFELTYAPSGYTNDNNATYVFYAFHSVEGYSKVGGYTGNGNADGTFVFTGFRPAWVLIKCTNAAESWNIFDTARDPSNLTTQNLNPNVANAESDASSGNRAIDILSNGFKCRGSNSAINNGTYIYLAFAESPFKFSNAR